MRHLAPKLLYTLIAFIIPTLLSCDRSDAISQPPSMMPEVAAEALTSAEHVSVVWVLTPADCLSCAGQDIEIRDVMYDMAPGQIIAVTRGDSVARSTVRSFLIRRRIDVPVVALTADEWRTYWQAVPTPEILVYNNSRLEWAASQRGMLADSVELLRHVIARLTKHLEPCPSMRQGDPRGRLCNEKSEL